MALYVEASARLWRFGIQVQTGVPTSAPVQQPHGPPPRQRSDPDWSRLRLCDPRSGTRGGVPCGSSRSPPPLQHWIAVQRKKATKASTSKLARPTMDLRRNRMGRDRGRQFPSPLHLDEASVLSPLTEPCSGRVPPGTFECTASASAGETTTASPPPATQWRYTSPSGKASYERRDGPT